VPFSFFSTAEFNGVQETGASCHSSVSASASFQWEFTGIPYLLRPKTPHRVDSLDIKIMNRIRHLSAVSMWLPCDPLGKAPFECLSLKKRCRSLG